MLNNKSTLRNFFHDKYLETVKLLPAVGQKNSEAYTMLIFTFSALSIFGFFAIKPTLATIADLKKQLQDSQFVNQALTTKIANLTTLQSRYSALTPDLPLVFSAIPTQPQAPILLGQIQALAQKQNLTLNSLQASQVEITKKQTGTTPSSFTFFLEATGSYNEFMQFIKNLTDFNRITTIENINFTISQKTGDLPLVLNLRGRAYFR